MPPDRAFADEQFEEEFKPCIKSEWGSSTCGSTRRVARFFLDDTRQIGFYCDQGHTDVWETGGHWIPQELFFDDGEYAHMRPIAFSPREKRLTRKVSLEINERRKMQARKAELCCECKCPPFADLEPRLQLAAIKTFRPTLFARLSLFFKAYPLDELSTWRNRLPKGLLADVVASERDSIIEAHHAVPVAVLMLMYDVAIGLPQVLPYSAARVLVQHDRVRNQRRQIEIPL